MTMMQIRAVIDDEKIVDGGIHETMADARDSAKELQRQWAWDDQMRYNHVGDNIDWYYRKADDCEDEDDGWHKMPPPKYAFEPSESDDLRRENLTQDARLIEDWIRAKWSYPYIDDPLDVVSYLQIAEDGDPDAIAGRKCAIGEIDFPEARIGDWWINDGDLGVIARIENGKVQEVS